MIEIMNLILIFSLIFFEHQYLSHYLCYQSEMSSVWVLVCILCQKTGKCHFLKFQFQLLIKSKLGPISKFWVL